MKEDTERHAIVVMNGLAQSWRGTQSDLEHRAILFGARIIATYDTQEEMEEALGQMIDEKVREPEHPSA